MPADKTADAITDRTTDLLSLFKKKRYTGQQTVVVNFFGEASLLDNAKNFYFMKPDHHLLLRSEDFIDETALQARLDAFLESANVRHKAMLDEAIDEFIQTNSDMQGNAQNKDKILTNLKHFGVKAKARVKYYKLLVDNKDGLKERLKQVAGERSKKKLAALAKSNDLGKKLKRKLPKVTAAMQQDMKFLDDQALALISNPDTQPVIASALRAGPQEIICSASPEKFMSNGHGFVGQSLQRVKRIIVTLDTHFHVESPSFSPLGGYGTSGATTSCVQEGKIAGASLIRTPLKRLLAEELHDYMMGATVKNTLADVSSRAKKELSNARELIRNLLQGKGKNKKPDTSLNAIKAQLNEIKSANAAQKKYLAKNVKPIQQTAHKLSSIASKVISGQTLSGKEASRWQQMKTVAMQAESASRTKKPGIMLLAETKGPQAAGVTTHQLNGVDMNFAPDGADLYQSHCEISSDQQINRFKVTPDNPWSDKQIAWLYHWMENEINTLTGSIQKTYSPDRYKIEFLGKMFAYYDFFPGYIEGFLPTLHHDFLAERERIIALTAAPDGTCTGDDCSSACVQQPSISDIKLTPATNERSLLDAVTGIATSALQSIDSNMGGMLMLQFANISFSLLQQWCGAQDQIDGIYGKASSTFFGGFNSTSQYDLLALDTQQLTAAYDYPCIH